MANGFKVNEKTKTVTVYRLSMAESDYKIIERYKALEYNVIMLEKKEPPKRTGLKAEDLIQYLNNGNIPEAIYTEMKERIDKKQNFLRVKSWLINELKDYSEKNKKEYIPLADIVKNAKENENLQNAKQKQNKSEISKTEKVVKINEEAM